MTLQWLYLIGGSTTVGRPVRSLYNTKHRHSKLRFVTPEQRHTGEDVMLLEQRKRVLEQAKQSKPSRWSTRSVKNCDPVGPTTLNPEKELPMKQAA